MNRWLARALLSTVALLGTTVWAPSVSAGSFPLMIVQPQPGLTDSNRFYRAYPGIPYRVSVAAKGGTFPYQYSVLAGPSGLAVSKAGTVEWLSPPAAGTPVSVTVRVTDSAGETTDVSWSIRVTTQGFYFVDASAPAGGAGTIQSPWSSWTDIYRSGSDTSLDGAFIYFRSGSYALPAALAAAGTGGSLRLKLKTHPRVYLAYPGEEVIFNQNSGAPLHLHIEDATDDYYFDGLTFTNGVSFSLEVWAAKSLVVKNCTFSQLSTDPALSVNQAAISMRNDALWSDGTQHTDPPATDESFKKNYVIQGNSFVDISAAMNGIGLYGVKNILIEGNSFERVAWFGVSVKSTTVGVAIRGNFFGVGSDKAINLQAQYYAVDTEISFNRVFSTLVLGGFPADQGPMSTVVERNTIVAPLWLKSIEADDGPVIIKNNVVINDDFADHVRDQPAEHYSIVTVKSVLEGNLMGVPSAAIVDDVGDLTAKYSEYVGRVGYQLPNSMNKTPSPPAAVEVR